MTQFADYQQARALKEKARAERDAYILKRHQSGESPKEIAWKIGTVPEETVRHVLRRNGLKPHIQREVG